MREFQVKFHKKNWYHTNHNIGLLSEIQYGIYESSYEFSLNHIAFFSNESKPPFIYVCMNVATFNTHSRKAIPVETTVKTVRSQWIEIQLESENFIWTLWLANLHFQIVHTRFHETTFRSKQGETWLPLSKGFVFIFGVVDGDNGFENMIKRVLFLIVAELLLLQCNIMRSLAFKSSIPRWILCLGNQSGCENSLSYMYVILAKIHALDIGFTIYPILIPPSFEFWDIPDKPNWV